MSQIEIVIEAIDNATKEIGAINRSLDSVKDKVDDLASASKKNATEQKNSALAMTELNSTLNLAQKGFDVISGVLKTALNDTVAYAAQVRELSRTIGASAEETSKLIQAGDDVGVSVEELSGALQAAIRKGVKPTIAGIGELADTYNSIQDPIERTKFLMDNFGRSGTNLAALMEKGSAGIKALGDAAEATGQVLTSQTIQATREYEIALDDLQDEVQGLTLAIGKQMIPVLTEAAKAGKTLFTWNREVAGALQEHNARVLSTADGYVGYVSEMTRAAAVAGQVAMTQDEYNSLLTRQTFTLADAVAKQDALKNAYIIFSEAQHGAMQGHDQEMIRLRQLSGEKQIVANTTTKLSNEMAMLQTLMAGAVGKAQDDYATKTHDINVKQSELSKEIAETSRLYGEASPKVVELKGKYGDLSGQLDIVNGQFKKTIDQLIFAAAQSALFADGVQMGEVPALMSLAESLGLVDLGTANLYTSFENLALSNTTNGIPAWTGMNQKAKDWHDTLVNQAIPSTDTMIERYEKLKDKQLAGEDSAKKLAAAIIAIPNKDVYVNTYYRNFIENYSYGVAIPEQGTRYLPNNAMQEVSVQERDHGGRGIAGRPYLIGRGAQPELFVPDSSGTFIPNAGSASAGGTTININVGGSVISEGELIREVVNGLRRENLINNGAVLSV